VEDEYDTLERRAVPNENTGRLERVETTHTPIPRHRTLVGTIREAESQTPIHKRGGREECRPAQDGGFLLLCNLRCLARTRAASRQGVQTEETQSKDCTAEQPIPTEANGGHSRTRPDCR